MYLDGRYSGLSTWTDSEDTDVDATNNGAQLAPYGYIFDGVDDYVTDTLGVNGETITQFTMAAVITRNENSNNEGIIQNAFGNNFRPRIYFVGTTLTAEVQIDNVTRTVTVANVGSYIKPGQPAFIVFRGDVTTGIEVLIDGVSRGTDSNTGTLFGATGAGNFNLGKDANLSYFQKGATRLVAICASKMTNDQLTAWRAQLEYEGFFAIWRDNFAKWSGEEEFSSGVVDVSGSPYVTTLVES